MTFWSHWAAEVPKRTFVEEAIRQFEAKNPGIKIKQTWYEKTALYAGLKTALRANQAPDIFYAEPDQAEYMENGFLLDLSELNWAAVEPWAKEAWTYQGKPYGLPLEAWTVELYYNKKTMADLGVSVPESLQLSPDAFLDMVKKAKAKSITPMALGVGDRPYPGAHLVHEALLKRLGVDDYDKLLDGKLPWSDPRVVDTLKWVKGLTEAGLLPTTFTTLKLAEAHGYFHTNPGALTFLNGSWYTSRAFNPVDKGGQPDGLPARHHAVSGGAGRGLQRVPVDRHRRQLRRQCRDQARQGGDGVLQLVLVVRDGQPLARHRQGADRHQERSLEDDGQAGCRLLRDDRQDQCRGEIPLRHPDPGHERQAEGGVHAGDQQCLPGRHHQRRGRGQADDGRLLMLARALRLRDQILRRPQHMSPRRASLDAVEPSPGRA